MAGDCGPYHPQKYWIFRLVSLKSLSIEQEKIYYKLFKIYGRQKYRHGGMGYGMFFISGFHIHVAHIFYMLYIFIFTQHLVVI